jgi:hypothetical protein
MVKGLSARSDARVDSEHCQPGSSLSSATSKTGRSRTPVRAPLTHRRPAPGLRAYAAAFTCLADAQASGNLAEALVGEPVRPAFRPVV